MPFLPLLFAWVAPFGAWILRLILVSIVARFIIAAGVAVAVFVGFEFLVAEAWAIVATQFAGLPSEVVGFVGLLKLDVAASMILGAYAYRAAFLALKQMRIVRT